MLEEFWKPFAVLLKEKEKSVTREEAVQVRELGTDPNSGRPVSARFGRFGPFIQIGTREDEEKPKWKGLQPGQSMFNIQLPEALELFKLPRALGNLPTGEPVSTNTGQFGPYVQYETVDQATGEVKKKYVSLREHDPYKITLDEAIEVIRAKQEADANKLIKDYGVDNLRLLRGRWGPYLTDGEKNARLPKDREPETITLDEARELILNAPMPKRRWGRPVTKKKVAKKAAKKAAPKAAAAGAGGNGARRRTPPQTRPGRRPPARRRRKRPAPARRRQRSPARARPPLKAPRTRQPGPTRTRAPDGSPDEPGTWPPPVFFRPDCARPPPSCMPAASSPTPPRASTGSGAGPMTAARSSTCSN